MRGLAGSRTRPGQRSSRVSRRSGDRDLLQRKRESATQDTPHTTRTEFTSFNRAPEEAVPSDAARTLSNNGSFRRETRRVRTRSPTEPADAFRLKLPGHTRQAPLGRG